MTKIITCNCKTGTACEFQDEEYGKNKRVSNVDSKGKAKCTCCGRIEN